MSTTPTTIELLKKDRYWVNADLALAFTSKREARAWAGPESIRRGTPIRLKFRLRKAGAGAPSKPADTKRVNLVVRVRPDVKAGFAARAKRNGTSAGEEVDKAHDYTVPDNAIRHERRTAHE